ncbi:MAG: Smr/MutS family protein [Gemmatimonadaceae bacterium]
MALPDEVRFGPQLTLNLREGLPSADDAVHRAEQWLREQQIKGRREVLVITGRGNQSLGGIPIIRPAVERLLFSLRRRGVVGSHQSHNPGAFVVELAPLRALTEAPARRREAGRSTPVARTEIHGLERETVNLLHDLAERALDALGIVGDEGTVAEEMQRQLALIAPGLGSGPRMEERLRQTLRAAIAEYD